MFTRKRKHVLRKQIQTVRMNVREHEMLFKQKVSHWLKVWLDTELKLKMHHQNCI